MFKNTCDRLGKHHNTHNRRETSYMPTVFCHRTVNLHVPMRTSDNAAVNIVPFGGCVPLSDHQPFACHLSYPSDALCFIRSWFWTVNEIIRLLCYHRIRATDNATTTSIKAYYRCADSTCIFKFASQTRFARGTDLIMVSTAGRSNAYQLPST